VSRYRYGAWRGGDDPLAPPFDPAEVVDALGDRVLAGQSPTEALRDVLRRGLGERRGLDALREQVRRRRDVLRRGDLAGVLAQVRDLLDSALADEREALAAADDPAARAAEAELDALPDDVAQAVRDLADHDWRSPTARQTYEQIRDLVRRDVLGQQLRGRREPASSDAAQAAQAMQATKDLLADLNRLLAAHARGEDTTQQFDAFMQRHGDQLDEQPRSVDELVDALAQRAAAAARLLASLDPQQRAALRDLVAQALADDPDLERELAQLRDTLRTLRPGLDWTSRQQMREGEQLGYVEATDALAGLAALSDLSDQLGQDYPGATLDDVDVEALAQALGPSAGQDAQALRRLERELLEAGWLTRSPEGLQLSARAVRRLGQTALRRVLDQVGRARAGTHDQQRAGAAGELTGASRAWEVGTEQPLDVVRTLQQALLRQAADAGPASRPGGPVGRLQVSDLTVAETETRTSAAVALLVDLSYSMVAQGRWAPMKQTALALAHLVGTRYRQDALTVVGFDRWARPLTPAELTTVEPGYVQGTNLQHALLLAQQFLRRHPDAQPVVLVVTDGEPTVHLEQGEAVFAWPPLPQTVAATVSEVDELTRLGAALTFVMLGDDPGLQRFVQAVARRSGGRVLTPSLDRLGEYVVSDYLRARRTPRR
jgi:uncharacterized protein with von Willebrand factor type A (vWA) domain